MEGDRTNFNISSFRGQKCFSRYVLSVTKSGFITQLNPDSFIISTPQVYFSWAHKKNLETRAGLVFDNGFLISGFAILPEGGVKLISQIIETEMKVPVSVLMGANLANEVPT